MIQPFDEQLSLAQFPHVETVAMNFSTFRFIVALISAAVFTGRTKVWRLCRSTSPQYHFGAIKVNPATSIGCPLCAKTRHSALRQRRYSITSSAMESKPDDTSMPSARAV
jgi:hypothetical protein